MKFGITLIMSKFVPTHHRNGLSDLYETWNGYSYTVCDASGAADE